MDIFLKRRKALKEKLYKEDIDAFMVLYPANRFYLSGFELHDPQCNESAGFLIITKKDKDYLCTDPRYYNAALRLWEKDSIFIYTTDKYKQIVDFITKNNIKNLGFEKDILTYEFYSHLKEQINMVPYKGFVEQLREMKDEKEIELLKVSCKLNHKLFEFVKSINVVGMLETELEWEIEKFFRENGAQEMAFKSIVASGKNAALPHYIPGKEKIKSDKCLLIDTGCRLNAYCSDQTRTFWVGNNAPEYFEKTAKLVKEAVTLAVENLRPGMVIKDLYFLVKDFFNSHGVGERFTHALGHGIGLNTHEPPSIGPKNEKVFKSNMVVTIEPGLYFPEWGGFRWEHMVLIKEDGVEVL